MIRIAHLLPYMGVGGTEQMVLNLCRYRDAGAFETVVSAPEDGPVADEIRSTGTPVLIGPDAYRRVLPGADLLNLHWTGFTEGWHSIALRSGHPYVTTLHWPSSIPTIPAVTICTSIHAYEIQPFKDRCIAIPNGVDITRFRPRPRPERDEVIITCVCRPEKCAIYFWPAILRVLRRHPCARLQIVGNETDHGSAPDRVIFLGIRRDVPALLAGSDLFAYAPYPGRGTKDLVVMEAAAAGLPCVVSDIHATRESVEDGRTGYLTPFGDEEAFAERIGLLVENGELRARMGMAARRKAEEEFDIRTVAGRYERVYRAVLMEFARRAGGWASGID